ncbi:MAG: type IVB secretion system protein IcmM/DotJ [Legionellaceae bacterium]
MSRDTWRLVKESKRFYVAMYRKQSSILIFSVVLNVLLCVSVYALYFNLPMNDFYATNGATPPIQLTAMDIPNATSVPLLPDDMQEEGDAKVVPE